MIKTAIIGGTGIYDPGILEDTFEEEVLTPYGIVRYMAGRFKNKIVAFIPRHGTNHSLAPHLINYRANIWAMKKLGVKNIIATTAVGSLNLSMKPGEFVLPNQFLDFTKSRVNTFYEGGERGVVHVDMTSPYCRRIANCVAEAAKANNIVVHTCGTYVCFEGPRFETPAEISMSAKLGGDLVGMTNVPEVVLAREAEICYSTVSMVTNFAAGVSSTPLTHSEVLETMDVNKGSMKRLLMAAIQLLEEDADCSCQHALAEYGGFKL